MANPQQDIPFSKRNPGSQFAGRLRRDVEKTLMEFDFASGTMQPVIGGWNFTFVRATTALVADEENNVREVGVGEPRFQYGRRVANNLFADVDVDNWAVVGTGISRSSKIYNGPDGEPNQAVRVTVSSGTGTVWFRSINNALKVGETVQASFWIRQVSGPYDGNLRKYTGKGTNVEDPSAGWGTTERAAGTWHRLANASMLPITATGDNRHGFYAARNASEDAVYEVAYSQSEYVTGKTNQAPSEWVDPNADHGLGVNGVKIFPTTNANTVTNNVSDEAFGSTPISTGDIGLVIERELENVLDSINCGSALSTAKMTPSDATGLTIETEAYTSIASGHPNFGPLCTDTTGTMKCYQYTNDSGVGDETVVIAGLYPNSAWRWANACWNIYAYQASGGTAATVKASASSPDVLTLTNDGQWRHYKMYDVDTAAVANGNVMDMVITVPDGETVRWVMHSATVHDGGHGAAVVAPKFGLARTNEDGTTEYQNAEQCKITSWTGMLAQNWAFVFDMALNFAKGDEGGNEGRHGVFAIYKDSGNSLTMLHGGWNAEISRVNIWSGGSQAGPLSYTTNPPVNTDMDTDHARDVSFRHVVGTSKSRGSSYQVGSNALSTFKENDYALGAGTPLAWAGQTATLYLGSVSEDPADYSPCGSVFFNFKQIKGDLTQARAEELAT